MKSKIIILTVLLISSLNVVAQGLSVSGSTDESVVPVIELNAFLSTSSQTSRTSAVSNVTLLNIQNVKDLVYNTQPSIYFYGDAVKVFGDKPRNLFTDLNSIGSLNNSVLLKNNIEIITINLDNPSQINNTFNLSLLSEFKNLKYIYFVTSFDVSNDAMSTLVQGDSEKYLVFYKVQKGDNN
jgi:hypothetical protein